MLYYCDDLYFFDPSPLLPLLSDARREKAERFREETEKKNCVFSYFLLREALRREYGFLPSENAEFSLSETGKPYGKEYPAFFSLSHCRKGTACALSAKPKGEVGVDIQDHRKISPSLIENVCSQREQAEIADSEPEKAFSRLWSLKESFLKQSGKGVGAVKKLPALDFSGTKSRFRRFGKEFYSEIFPDFSISLCAEEIPDEIFPIRISAEEILREALKNNG